MRRLSSAQRARRKHDVGALVEALSHHDVARDDAGGVVDFDAPVRLEALAGLGELEPAELEDGRAAEAAIACLQDPVPTVRGAAVRVAGRLDAQGARPALVEGVLTWPDPPYGEARQGAVDVLQEVDDPVVLEQLIASVAASNGAAIMDGTTRSALMALGSDSSGESSPEGVVELLIEMLRDTDNPRNIEIMLAWLAEHSTDDLVEALDDRELRLSAATVLGALRESRGVAGLSRCLEDDRAEVRLAAARALGEIRDVRSVEGLIRAVADEDFEVRRQAQEALDALGTVGIVAGVSAVLTMTMREQQAAALPPNTDPENRNLA